MIRPDRDTNKARSASPSNATPGASGRFCEDHFAETIEMQRTGIQIDVAAIGRAIDSVDRCAEPLEKLRG